MTPKTLLIYKHQKELEEARETELTDVSAWMTGASDEDEHCKFYSNADMAKITSSALSYVTWHVTYFRDLRIFIRSLESKEEVEQVTYGMDIPEAYQSEPLKAMLAQKS